MKKAKLLGYSEESTHVPAGTESYSEHDEGGTVYRFYVELEESIYYFTFEYSYGSCGSGWCGASWGCSDTSLIGCTNVPELKAPKKTVYVNVIDNKVQTSVLEEGEWHDSVSTSVKTTTGIVIVSETGDGGCQYYSSGQVIINENLF